MAINEITAREAASVINNGDNIGLSGFTACGTPKAVTEALAELANEAHEKGQQFKVNIFTGASTNDHVDGALGRAKAIDKRSPYQSTADSRKGINAREINYFDIHLSEMAQKLRYGFYGPLNVGIIEAADITPAGDVVLGTGVGMSPTVSMMAEKVIIELNDQINPECAASMTYTCRLTPLTAARYPSTAPLTASAPPSSTLTPPRLWVW